MQRRRLFNWFCLGVFSLSRSEDEDSDRRKIIQRRGKRVAKRKEKREEDSRFFWPCKEPPGGDGWTSFIRILSPLTPDQNLSPQSDRASHNRRSSAGRISQKNRREEKSSSSLSPSITLYLFLLLNGGRTMPIANRSCNEPIRPQRPRIRTHNNHRSKQCSAVRCSAVQCWSCGGKRKR